MMIEQNYPQSKSWNCIKRNRGEGGKQAAEAARLWATKRNLEAAGDGACPEAEV